MSALTSLMSRHLGTPEVDSGTAFFLCVLSGYPLALIFRQLRADMTPTAQHLYLGLSGFLLGFACYGFDVIHSLLSITITYLLLAFIPSRFVSLVIAFSFNLIYLLGGYYFMASEGYDIDWTTPQCVLCLRLISLAFDYYDGGEDESTLGADERKYRLTTMPSFPEVLGYSYFFGAFFAGPQFPINRYKLWISGNLYGKNKDGTPKKQPECLMTVLECLALGVTYLIIFTIMNSYYPTDYLKTPAYFELPFLQRFITMNITMCFSLFKYIGIWITTEGPCILLGLAFNGYNADGTAKWDGLTNIRSLIFLTGTNLRAIIDTWNINTNDWLKRYIFKRLKSFDNRQLSSFVSLFFLALWHGTAPGYFICFGLEFVYLEAEKKLQILTAPVWAYLSDEKGGAARHAQYVACLVLAWFVRSVCFYLALAPFVMKSFTASIGVLNSLYWYGLIGCFFCFAAAKFIRLPKTQRPATPQVTKKTE
eukprot:TRINITY_DN2860_c0_g1_i1.p1 TRINITY_DN2860_c0_g1~~TRINITY_DN2860_c0_g1_i1.p1  ORF type:complete len:479 (+),score=174.23 TRINITY_DN2860_c0_g1_i1:29-1465(+)